MLRKTENIKSLIISHLLTTKIEFQHFIHILPITVIPQYLTTKIHFVSNALSLCTFVPQIRAKYNETFKI